MVETLHPGEEYSRLWSVSYPSEGGKAIILKIESASDIAFQPSSIIFWYSGINILST